MPTHLVLCARAGQTHLSHESEIPIPPLGPLIRLYEDVAEACGAFIRPTTIGVALNTFGLTDVEARADCDAIERELGLPCVDPVRHGVAALTSFILDSSK